MTRMLEDLPLGQEFPCGSFTLTEAEIIDFAGRFDPQPWHLDHDQARASFFAGLCASGLHSQAAAIGQVVREIPDVAVIAGGSLHEARFFVPVRPGQPYSVTACWTSIREQASNPTRGVAALRIFARDAEGETVMECGVTYIVARRAG